MKRRVLSWIMVVMLLLPTVTFAATPVSITSDDIQGNVGDTVTATLNIVVEPPKLGQTMDSLQFVLEYDSAALEYIGIQELSQDRITILGAQYMCNVTTKAGAVAFAAAATTGGTGSGVMMHVRFRLLSAVSTMLVLKKVSYSFVTGSSGSQRGYTGGTINLGRITGQSAPTTIPPASYAPMYTQSPSNPVPSIVPTDAPRFPVTEVTLAPGMSPAPEPVEEDSDILAYIVFGLFIVVAIMICVVVTMMIVRRGRNKSQEDFFEDEESDRYDDRYEDEDAADDRGYRRVQSKEDRPRKAKQLSYEEDEYEQPRKKKKPVYDEDAYERPRKKQQLTYRDDDEMPIEITRTGKSSKSSDSTGSVGKKKPKKYE